MDIDKVFGRIFLIVSIIIVKEVKFIKIFHILINESLPLGLVFAFFYSAFVDSILSFIKEEFGRKNNDDTLFNNK